VSSRAVAGAAALRASKGEAGQIKIGYSHTALYSHAVLQALVDYRRVYPDVDIQLIAGTTRRHVADIEAGTLDMAFARGPLPSPASHWPPERRQRIATEKLLLALPDSHPLANSPRIGLEQLRGEPFVAFSHDMGTALNEAIANLIGDLNQDIQVAVETKDMASLLGLVGVKAGMALVPESVSHLHAPHVVFRELDTAHAAIDLYFLTPKKTSALVENLSAQIFSQQQNDRRRGRGINRSAPPPVPPHA
jgi:DNA-binding transcriptional LysR family regulator